VAGEAEGRRMSMHDMTITLRGTSGRETTAPVALWLKCMLEMLPPPQLVELANRVAAHESHLVVPGIARHFKMIAEHGQIGTKLGG
jgi:hypothetical protein